MISIWRFPIVLALSVVFGLPALQKLMMNPQSLFRAGFQYLGALVLAWFGVNMVFGVMEHYAQHNRRIEEKEEAERIAADLLEQRRADEEAEQQREKAEREALAQELSQKGTPVQRQPVGSPMPAGQPQPLGQPVSLDEADPGSPMPQPSTASIAQDLLREEAGSGII